MAVTIIGGSDLFYAPSAFSRYIKIFHPLRTSFLMTTRAAYIISGSTWAFFLVPVPVYITLMLKSKTIASSPANTCDVLHIESVKVFYNVLHGIAFIIFLSVLLCLVFCYYSASRRVFEMHQRKMGSSNSKRLVQSRRNMLVLVTVFCICFVPHHLVRLPYIIFRAQCSVVLYYLKEVTVLVSVFNICLDPLIYIFLCKDFRAQFNLQIIFPTTKDNSSISMSEAEVEAEH